MTYSKECPPPSVLKRLGEVVRYGDGPSALMRVTEVRGDRWYGTQYFGGPVSAYVSDIERASQRDLASWRWAHDSNDEWVRGRYAYRPPSHVVLVILSSRGHSYVSKPLSLTTPYKLDLTSTEARTYEQLIRRQGAHIVGRWHVTLKDRANV